MGKVNGRPLEQVEPRALQFKLQEPVLLLGKERFADIDIRIRVKGGGHTSQIYAIRSLLMNRASKRSRISLSSLTVPCLLLTQEETNPRSLEVPEPEPDTRSPTVKLYISISAVFIPSMFHLGNF